MAAISIFGIGYVGIVAAACLADAGHTVIAVDIDPNKVDAVNKGLSPIVENGLSDIVARNVASGRLKATTSAKTAIMDTNMSFVCVGTPSETDGAVGLKHVLGVCEDIAVAMGEKGAFHSVVVRSTVVPGTMDEHCIPMLESASGMQAGRDFGVGYYPEFLRESTAVEDFHHPSLIVFGAMDAWTEAMLRDLNKDAGEPCHVVALATAEMVKYASNSWRAVKITFANEIGNIAKACGVDGQEVMGLLCQDTKVNISPAFMRPGFAFGGSCLPKDVRALRHIAAERQVEAPLLTSVLAANTLQIDRAERMIEASGSKSIGLVGIAFKPGTDDLRESPLAELAGRLIAKGFDISIYDPYVTEALSNGVVFNGRGNEAVPELSDRMVARIDDLIKGTEVIIVGNRYEETLEPLHWASGSHHLVDLARISPKLRSNGFYEGICW